MLCLIERLLLCRENGGVVMSVFMLDAYW